MDGDSDSGPESEDDRDPSLNRKKARYSQKYISKWEDIYQWIAPCLKDPLKFRCKICNKDYRAGKTEAKNHSSSKIHLKNANALKGTGPITTAYEKKEDKTDDVKNGEIRLAAFIAEHNVPFTIADDLPNLIRAVCPDSKIAVNLKGARTKMTKITTNVLGKAQEEKLIAEMKRQPFSLLIDESTDVGSEKHLALVVRMKDQEEDTIKDKFAALLPIGADASADALFSLIKNWFSSKGIPLSNMVGFAADGASVMMGRNNSVSARLKNELPNLFIMKCICHSMALCASQACTKLPEYVEVLLRDIYKYFKFSTKKTEQLKEFQDFVNIKPHKILHPSATRWLSLHQCIERILEQWGALQLYFRAAAAEDAAASAICAKLEDGNIKSYFLFLDYILPFVVDLNKEMQAESPKLYILYSRMETTYKTILKNFLKKQFYDCSVKDTESLREVNFMNPQNLRPLDEVYLGGKVNAHILNHSTNREFQRYLPQFRSNCVIFYQELLRQIYKRFPFHEYKFFKAVHMLSPQEIAKGTFDSIIPLVVNLPDKSVVPEREYNEIDREYQRLTSSNFEWFSKNHEFEAFWGCVKEIKLGSGEPGFPLLIKLVQFIAILPQSTATVERVFSLVNLNKTKSRNRLCRDTLVGILHTKRLFGKRTAETKTNKKGPADQQKNEEKIPSCCSNFEITKNMRSLMNNENLYSNN